MGKKLSQFLNQYPVSKTLRFKLIPVGKTEENLAIKRLIEEDEVRSEEYKAVKKIIDRYHKSFISRVLTTYRIPDSDLEEYCELFYDRDKDQDKNDRMASLEVKMRKGISKAFKEDSKYNDLFSSALFSVFLPAFLTDEEECRLVKGFENFTTAFSGFHENRENMYSEGAESTAISYRIVNENLPKFLRNVKVFREVQEALSEDVFDKMDESLATDAFSVKDFFSKDFFNWVLSNEGIEVYNTVLGGYVNDEGIKIQGLNEYINLYNQQLGKAEKSKRIPRLTPLFKQILSDRTGFSFVDSEYTSDEDVYRDLDFLTSGEFDMDGIAQKVCALLNELDQYDLDGIYCVNGEPLSSLSQALTGSWSSLRSKWEEEYDSMASVKKLTEKYYETRSKKFASCKSFSLSQMDTYLSGSYTEMHLIQYINAQASLLAESILSAKGAVVELIGCYTTEADSLINRKDVVEKIKKFLDSVKDFERFVRAFEGTGKEERDEAFYGTFIPLVENLRCVDRIYNRIRNYASKKPYSTDKFKLYFQNPQFLGGWDRNKVADYRSTMLRMGEEYYIIVIDKQNSKVLNTLTEVKERECELLDYKLISGASKSLPHKFFSRKGIEEFSPSERVLRIYNSEPKTYLKGPAFKKEDCHAVIDYYKSAIQNSEWQADYDFKFTDTKKYEDISGFFREVDRQGYRLKFRQVDKKELFDLVEEGKIYLFKIYNKDFSVYSHGRENLHTMFFRQLFVEAGNDIKLCGGAEMFMRRASIKNRIVVHPAGQAIKNKNPLNLKKETVFPYDITKDKRYTVDQYEIHIPITLNRTAVGGSDINRAVRELLKADDNPYVIGIDRGERNLLYVSVIDGEGKIVEQMSLNEIVNEHNGIYSKTDYHRLLDEKEKERLEARQQWKTIENIKELKEGYISQVVAKICELVLKYDAVVAMEDLNSGFKNSRRKVEKQVYQNFEKALIIKLNYLCSKALPIGAEGSITAAYQITKPFESFKAMGTQNGFIFYIPAWLTSKIDPSTGFVDLLNLKYTSIADARTLIMSFDFIRYNEQENLFEFGLDYGKFPKGDISYVKKWTLYSFGDRIRTFRNAEKNHSWDNEELDMTEAFKNWFDAKNISYESGNDLRSDICKSEEKEFYVEFLGLVKLMLQMRNSITGRTDVDYLISPVKGKNGTFFDSRKAYTNLPLDADANGAYNIARKVLWAIDVFKSTETDKLKSAKIAISNKEWLRYAQENHG